jgi:hypothetical protein
MLGAALALIAIGIVLLFVLPWVGIPVGILGLVLALVYAFSAVRRPVQR